MASPTFASDGLMASTNTGTTLGYTTDTLGAAFSTDDIMLLQVMTNAANDITVDQSFNTIDVINSANQSSGFFWKRMTSNVAFTVTATVTGTALSNSNGLFIRALVFSGCVTTGTPYEGLVMTGTPTLSTTPATGACVTTAVDTLVVALVNLDDDNTWSSGFPATGWSQTGTRRTSTTGGDCALDAMQIARASAGTEAAVTMTQSASDYWRVATLALMSVAPAAAASLIYKPFHQASTVYKL